MKRFWIACLALMLFSIPALADQFITPMGSGISFDVEGWLRQMPCEVFYQDNRSPNVPCEFTEVLLYTSDGGTDFPAFELFARRIGSDAVPTFSDLTQSEKITATDDYELYLYYYDSVAHLPASAQAAATIPVEWYLSHPEDLILSEPSQLLPLMWDGLSGIDPADGTPVAPSIYEGHALTMLNVWATYCNPCIREMPDLALLNRDYADKGFQIVGIISDVNTAEAPDEEGVEYANLIIERTRAEYQHVVPAEGMFYGALRGIRSVPTTYFVDENGLIVSGPYAGIHTYDEWAALIEKLLESVHAQ